MALEQDRIKIEIIRFLNFLSSEKNVWITPKVYEFLDEYFDVMTEDDILWDTNMDIEEEIEDDED